MNINRYMFGNTEAALNLADMLTAEANPIYLRKVGRFLSNNAGMCRTLSQMQNDHHRRAFAKMLKHSILNSNMELPEKIKTHALNVAVGKLRRTMDSLDSHPEKVHGMRATGGEFDFEGSTNGS